MLLARTHLCIPNRNPSRTESFRNTRIRKASRKTPGLLITVKAYFIISTTDLSLYFPVSFKDGVSQTQGTFTFCHLTCHVLQRSLSHLLSAAQMEGDGKAAEERLKLQLKSAGINQAFLHWCKAWKYNVGIRHPVSVNTSFFLNWLGCMKF